MDETRLAPRRLARVPMKHRHLVDGVGFAPAAIDDILDVGSPRDWTVLFRQIERDPHGAVASDVLAICGAHHMYGTSALWTAIVERLRAQSGNVA